MAILVVEVSKNTVARLEREAETRGMGLPEYLRSLLGDLAEGNKNLLPLQNSPQAGEESAESFDDLAWLDSPQEVVARIRAHGPSKSLVQEPTADLAELLRTGGVESGISSEEWDRRWAAFEAEQKAIDLADLEETLRETRHLVDDDHSET